MGVIRPITLWPFPENIFKKRNSDKRGDYGYVYYDESHYEQPCYCIDINFTFRFRS